MWKKLSIVTMALVLVSGVAACDRVRDVAKPDASETMTLSPQDAMFLQMMIPHHEQAVEMVDLAMSQSESKKLRIFAKGIQTVQEVEIEKMRSWLSEAGYSADDSHSHMMMDGMLSDAKMSELRNAQGKEFDSLFLSGMIAHHRGAIEMAQTEIDRGENPKVKALAVAIVAAQNAEILAMRAIQKLNER